MDSFIMWAFYAIGCVLLVMAILSNLSQDMLSSFEEKNEIKFKSMVTFALGLILIGIASIIKINLVVL